MKIGFDLDKVFIDYPPLIPARVIEKLYKKSGNGSLVYRIPSAPEQAIRRISHYSLFRPPIQKNISFLNSIAHKEHKLYLISSRFDFLESATLALLKKYKFDKIFDKTYFNFNNRQPHKFKEEVISKLNLDVYVDDDLPLLEYIASKNNKTDLFWLNSVGEKINPGHNIHSISDISKIIKN